MLALVVLSILIILINAMNLYFYTSEDHVHYVYWIFGISLIAIVFLLAIGSVFNSRS